MNAALPNFVAFQINWFANILGAANGVPWLGPLVTTLWMVAHFASFRGPNRRSEVRTEGSVIVFAAALGWLADSALVLAGLLQFPEYTRLGQPSPLWMMALWIGFAATLRHCLGWLRGRWLLGAVLGAIGGPLAYAGGAAFGVIELAGNSAFAAVSLQYALATPMLLGVIWLRQSTVPETRNDSPTEVRT